MAGYPKIMLELAWHTQLHEQSLPLSYEPPLSPMLHVNWQVIFVPTVAHNRVVSATPTHGVQIDASFNTMQLPLPAAAMSTDWPWNDMTLDHSPGDGGAKK